MPTNDEVADVEIIDDGGYALWGTYEGKIVFIDLREASLKEEMTEEDIPKVGQVVRAVVRPIHEDLQLPEHVTKEGKYRVEYSGSVRLFEKGHGASRHN